MSITATAHRSAERKSGFADVDGTRNAYEAHGQLGSAMTPLLVLHGSLMSGEAMVPFLELFAADRPAITVDARGHGRNGDLPAPNTYERMADDAAAVLRTLCVGSADVLGYSMGGTTAAVMAARHSARVGKLVIQSGAAARSGWRSAPRARLAILPASSHEQMMSQAPLIAQLVTPFFDDRAPPPPTGFFEGMGK